MKKHTVDSLVLKTDFLEYTYYLPANFISFSKHYIAYPLLGTYKVYILDNKLALVDSIQREMPDWVSPSTELHQSIQNNLKNINPYFTLLDEECFHHIHRIEYIDWLDSQTLLVRWYKYDSLLKHRLRYVDIWQKDSGLFHLLSSSPETTFPLNINGSIKEIGLPYWLKISIPYMSNLT